MPDIGKIFTAFPNSAWDFLITDGQGCYIPAYQRPYSWDRDNVSRLFEDAIHGIDQLMSRADAISFLGTIIAIHDTKYRTVHPVLKQEVASRVMTIIDGQQRICTFVMANIIVHDELTRLARRFEKATGEQFDWLHEQCIEMIDKLQKTFEIDRSTGTDNYRFYPRIIRSYSDQWSRRPEQAKYTSPIALLVWQYINYHRLGEKKAFRYKPADDDGVVDPLHLPIVDIFSFMGREIRNLCAGTHKEYEFPELLSIVTNGDFVDGIWGYELPSSIASYMAEQPEDSLYSHFCSALRTLVFSKYMNDRMAFTIVQTESEDDAFDMFEALNTTGEPLTAFETFKPRVIEQETLEKYETSPSFKHIGRIEEYLDAFKKAEQKQRATSELLIPFALAETGEKLQKRLNEQRRYLRDTYDGLETLDKKREFVRSLANLSRFVKQSWDIPVGQKPVFDPLSLQDEDVLVCLDALRQLKHHITLAPIFRFYDEAVRADEHKRPEKANEFAEALKATTAFSMFWRGAKGGTENIESLYREILRVGIADEKLPALAKRPKGHAGIVSLVNYKKALRHLLKKRGAVGSKEEWVKAASRTDIYKGSPVVARFLLFCASVDSVIDANNPGLIQRGRKGVAPIFTFERWIDADYFTVEHIAPQRNDGTWDAKTYDDDTIVHRLGNLILLPREENNLIGNRPWAHKKILYGLLSAETQDEFDDLAKQAAGEGLNFSKNAEEVLAKSRYLHMSKSISQVAEPWDLPLIENRSKRLAELAWDKLAPWLGL